MTINKIISGTPESNTYSNVALLSIWAGNALLGGMPIAMPSQNNILDQCATQYYSVMKDSSYDSHSNIFKEESLSAANMAIDQLIGLFYQKVLQSQEQLEYDFNNVYFKNAWNLYEK
jgi:hypothetical protein